MARDMTASLEGCTAESLESCFKLPDRSFADSLIDAYFSRIHRLYPFLHEGTFRAEYERMWDQPSPRSYSRLSWFSALNMVFAHGCEFCGTIPVQDVLAIAANFVARSRTILLSHIFKSSTVETVQSLLLMCYYLQGTVDLHECWNMVGLMIRTALSLGLHITSRKETFLPIERELRRRAWWGCFVLDRTISIKFGRPPSLTGEEGDAELPLEIDDQYINNGSVKHRQPSGTPSTISFFLATIKLSSIVYNVLTELYLHQWEKRNQLLDTRLQSPASICNQVLSRILLLDGQLQSWWDNIPQHLTRESRERERSWMDFQSQRTVLKIR